MKGNLMGYIASAIAAVMICSAAVLTAFGITSDGAVGMNAYAEGEYVQVLDEQRSPFADVVDVVMPCVVGVSNKTHAFSLYTGQTESVEQASGSGVVITTQGHVVTNYHVIQNAREIQLIWQGELIDAKLIGYDELTDLAVLQATEGSLPAVTMADPASVRVGDWAIVIGNPLGQQFADTVTVGVVSGLDREIENSIVKMIQTDAAINSGNSGGGMFNTRGQLIGIPSMKFTSVGYGASIEGIGMAIPMDVVKPIVESIIKFGQVTRPKLGITVSTIRGTETPVEGALPAGVYVSGVQGGGAAERAGVMDGDIILSVDGKRVRQHTDLTNVINTRTVGDTVELEIYRVPNLPELTVNDRIPKGETLKITVELVAQDASQA
ncbi:S1C family serine protease [Beduinella massiliensis]|uniref:S1C family serine protease n=1 Tax=Beduinella massiliensis TaxID=1852363 RepID=UPI0031F8A947